LHPQTINDFTFGHWSKNPVLKNSVPIPQHFRNNGYNSYGTGKLLHEGAEGDFYTDYGIASDYGPWPWQGKNKVNNTPHPKQYDQWKDHLPVYMHRDLNYAPLSDVPEWKPNPSEKIPGAKGWYNTDGKKFRYVNGDDRDKTPDEISADWAIDVINKKHDRPFYLGVGFIRPHTPLYAPKKYFDMFPIEDIQLPPYLKDDLKDCAPVLRNRWKWGFQKFEGLIKAGGEKAWKEWVRAYLACTAFVDDQIGKVLDALDSSDHSNNTIVVLTADNGYHIGEKDCIQKWHLWDDSTKVPLLISVPCSKKNGNDCTHPVSLVDIYPTLIDLCGLSGEPNKSFSKKPLDGRSLGPFLKNPATTRWQGPPAAIMSVRDKNEKAHFSVRSSRYRYTLCANGQEELYDHKNDPHEWTNLAGNKRYEKTKKKLRSELTKMLGENNKRI
jgi:arylsulfatase A-like enzyme